MLSASPESDTPASTEAPEAGPLLRLFVAVEAPEGVEAAAEGAIRQLRRAGEVRWVAPERLHLTLKFLGATPPQRAPQVEAALEETANKFSRFVVELGGVGAFPNVRRPQTLCLDLVGAQREALVALGDAVDAAVEPLGFRREGRSFRPHLTIGRVRSPRGLPELSRLLAAEAQREAEPVPWPVEQFCLVRSDLRPSGPLYTILRRFPLAGAG